MRYDEDGLEMLDLDSDRASYDEAGDCLLQDGLPFTGWAFENYEDGQLYTRIHYERGYHTGLLEIFYENGQIMSRHGDYDPVARQSIIRQWAENGQMISEETYPSTTCLPRYQKLWTDEGRLIYDYESPATYQAFKHGVETWWYEDGQIQERKVWSFGLCTEHLQWGLDGKVLMEEYLSEGSPEYQLIHMRKEKEAEMVKKYGELPVWNSC
jgi:MORN repeat variant